MKSGMDSLEDALECRLSKRTNNLRPLAAQYVDLKKGVGQINKIRNKRIRARYRSLNTAQRNRVRARLQAEILRVEMSKHRSIK